MNRRSLLKFLLSTPAAAFVDYEKLLWVPRPMIVVPHRPLLINLEAILEQELKIFKPHIVAMFERDDALFKMIKAGKVVNEPTGPMKVPLIIRPGGFHD